MSYHIGLIADGNRRWAKQNSLSYDEAYICMMRKIIEFILLFFKDKEVVAISIYLLSTANLGRSKEELTSVFYAETKFLTEMLPPVLEQFRCRAVHAGSLNLLPDDMQSALKKICSDPMFSSERNLYLLLAYDPIAELRAAVEMSLQRQESINLTTHFWVPQPVDVVIRSAGGPTLLSNFLPIQCGYAQLHTIDKYFNDCTEDDFLAIMECAKSTTMLYGN